MKIKIIFLQILIILSIKSADDELEEDEEIVYGIPKEESLKKKHPAEEVKSRMDNIKSNMVNLGYDFSKAIKILYSNYTNLELKVSDIDWLFKKGIINENQAILIWETLLNTKTERNLEWLGYNKINKIKETVGNNKMIMNIVTLFNSPGIKFHSFFTYIGGIILFYMMKFLLKFPKINMTLIFFLIFINIMHTFYFYNKKYYFTSCVNLCLVLSNIYYFYLSIVVLTGNKVVDYSILHTKYFKSKEHFMIKIGICTLFILILNYLTSVSLRYFLNYILIFLIIEKDRDMIKNYFKQISPRDLQPFDNFISLIFGAIILVYTHIFYYCNIYFSYDLNSFLIINNMITFYYITALDKYIYIQRNRLGDIYLECEKINDSRDKYERFEELKKKTNLEKNFRNETFSEGNIIDIFMIFLCILLLILGFYSNTYFYLLLAIFILHSIHKNCLIFLSIKISRIISSFLLLIFLVAISNLDHLNFSYINEIIAVYDPKFLDALLLLFKLLFLANLAICNYFSEDFVDLFNIYNYSSYLYLLKETRTTTNNGELSRRLNQIYTVPNVLAEIFQFQLSKSLDYVNSVLDSINNSGSNIDSFYIDHLLTNNSTNYYLFHMLCDYFLMYTNIWILFDTFRNNNHSFFYLTFIIHKVGIFCKLCLIMFEYSKTKMQKYFIIVLNIIISMRLINYPELEHIEIIVLSIFFLINVFIYIFIYDNYTIMNLFIIFFNFIIFNNFSNLLPLISIIIGTLFAKNLIYHLKIRHFRAIIFLVCAINSYIIFSSLDKKLITTSYIQLKEFLFSLLKIDIIDIVEDVCFLGMKIKENHYEKYLENELISKIKDFLKNIKNN